MLISLLLLLVMKLEDNEEGHKGKRGGGVGGVTRGGGAIITANFGQFRPIFRRFDQSGK